MTWAERVISYSRAGELMAILSAHTADLNGPSGGIPELTASDVSAALRGRTEGQYYLAMCKYVGEESLQPRLFYAVWDAAVQLSVKHHWEHAPEERGKAPIRKLCRLAIVEIVSPMKCPGCGGAGIYNDQRICVTCGGSGHIRVTEDMRREVCGITEDRWQVWRPRYEAIFRMILAWDKQVLRGLIKSLEDQPKHD